MRRRRQRLARSRRQTFVRLHDLPRTTARTTATEGGVPLSPLPNFDDVKTAVDVDSESLSDAFARKGYLEQQRAMGEAHPPSYDGLDGKVDFTDVKTDAEQQ